MRYAATIALLFISITALALAKDYTLYPEFSQRKIVFRAPPGMPCTFDSPYPELMFRASRSASLPEATIRVYRLYGENPTDPKDYVEDFAAIAATLNGALIMVEGAPRLIKDSPEPEITEVASSNGSPTHTGAIWCIRTEKHNDYLVTELLDHEIQVEIRFEALDADELLPRIAAFKAFTASVRIVPR